MRSCLLGTALALLFFSTAQAASPSLTAIRPVGGQRGTELDVTFSGARLGDALEILYYQPGITTLSIKKVNNDAVTARLKIAPDCTLGLHDLRVRTATGISELRTFSVGALKEIKRGRAQQRLRGSAADRHECDGQRRRRERGRRLLRRRGQEGRADLGRGRGAPAGDLRVRPLRGDPEREAVRAGRQRRRGAGPRATGSRRSSRRRMGNTSSRCARAPTRATARASTGSTWGTSPARRP